MDYILTWNYSVLETEMGSWLQLRATLTVRTRQVISKYDSPIRVQLCSAGILVFLWKPGAFMDENKRKTDQNDQMGCHVGQHPGSALVLSKSIKVWTSKIWMWGEGEEIRHCRDVGCTLSLVYLITQIYSWPQESQNDFIILPPLIGEMNAGMFYQLAAARPCWVCCPGAACRQEEDRHAPDVWRGMKIVQY